MEFRPNLVKSEHTREKEERIWRQNTRFHTSTVTNRGTPEPRASRQDTHAQEHPRTTGSRQTEKEKQAT